MTNRSTITAALVAAALAGVTGSALAASGGTEPGAPTTTVPTTPTATKPANPCLDRTRRPQLRCPDLIMYKPYDLYFDQVSGRTRLHAGNSIVNIGKGPAENFGVRIGPGRMKVVQHIYTAAGSRESFDNGGRLVFKHVGGGFGNYWKFYGAARFELWSLGAHNKLLNRVRIGAKLIYCLRDLNKRFSSPISPSSAHFPGCNQDGSIHSDTLGTSVGWSDDYPATYPQQYIDVTGLRGRFAFFQRVDPFNRMWELNENNNRSPMIILNLPRRTAASVPTGSGGGY